MEPNTNLQGLLGRTKSKGILGLALLAPMLWTGGAGDQGAEAVYVAQDFDFPGALEFTVPTAFGSGFIFDQVTGINAYFDFKGIVGGSHRYAVTGTMNCDCVPGELCVSLDVPPSP